MLALFAKQYFIRYLDFKSSILHCSSMENIFLVKIQKTVKKKKKKKNPENIHTITFCQQFLTQLKSRILTIKIGVIFLDNNIFFFARLNRFLYFWVFKRQISACRFLNHEVLICGFLLYSKTTCSCYKKI